MSDVEALISYIEAETPPELSGGDPPLESVYSFLSSRVAQRTPCRRAARPRSARTRCEGTTPTYAVGIARRHRRAVYPDQAARRHQSSFDAAPAGGLSTSRRRQRPDDFAPGKRRCHDTVSRRSVVQRILGQPRPAGGAVHARTSRRELDERLPLARIIATRLRYLESRGRDHKTAVVIRECMADVEQIARFEAPRLLACYVDLLQLHLSAC